MTGSAIFFSAYARVGESYIREAQSLPCYLISSLFSSSQKSSSYVGKEQKRKQNGNYKTSATVELLWLEL